MLSKSVFSIAGRSGVKGKRAASLRDEIDFLCSRVADRMDSAVAGPARLGVCCTFPGEGVTTVSANLAITLAEDGKCVALVEANQFHPSLASHFDVPTSPGLTQLRSREATVEEVSYQVADNLSVIPFGETRFGATRAGAETDLVGALGDAAEVVIFDLPPLSLATDTGRLMRDLDAVVLLVRANRTRKGDYLRSIKTLRELGVLLAGTVLNDVQYDIPPILSRVL